MASLPSIPKSIIKEKDKNLLLAFMSVHYEETLFDKRGAFDKILPLCKASIKRQKKFAADKVSRINIEEVKEARLQGLKRVAPERNKFLLENDTSKWPWDYDKIKYNKGGVGIGTAHITLKMNKRNLWVDRDTAPVWFVAA